MRACACVCVRVRACECVCVTWHEQRGKAIEYHTQRLAIAKEVGDRAGEGAAYGKLGTCHMHLNECVKTRGR